MIKKPYYLLFAAFLAASAPAAALAAEDSTTTQNVAQLQANENEPAKVQVQQAFAAWQAAISSGSSDAILKLYDKDAVLLPTFAPKVHNMAALRKVYFDELTKKPNLKATVEEEHIRVYGDIAINSGLYTFTYTDGKKVKTVHARFSFVYHKTPQGWLIVDHHSSEYEED